MNDLLHNGNEMTVVKVAIIGAGVAGLAALKVFTEPAHNTIFDVVAFEQSDKVGGLWNYHETDGPMYQNLKTNLPKELSAFPGYKYPEHLSQSFIEHKDILFYLNGFAKYFDLLKYITFNASVKNIKYIGTEMSHFDWLLSYEHDGVLKNGYFTSVIICSGNFSKPHIPANITGIANFSGRIMHSKSYRKPEDFLGEIVMLLGSSFSGIDICLELASTCKMVYLSHNHKVLNSNFPLNVKQVPGIKTITGRQSVELIDNKTIDNIDSIIWCTGYEYSFPFLDPSCGIEIRGDGFTIFPLYQHIINARHPTMFFLAIAKKVLPFPVAYLSAQVTRAVLEKRLTQRLPSSQQMIKLAEDCYQRMSAISPTIKVKSHEFQNRDAVFQYANNLADMVDAEHLMPALLNIWKKSDDFKIKDIQKYRNKSYVITDKNSYDIVIN